MNFINSNEKSLKGKLKMESFDCNTQNIWRIFNREEKLDGFRTCIECKTQHIFMNNDVTHLLHHYIICHQSRKRPYEDSCQGVSSSSLMDVTICKFVAIQKLPIHYLSLHAPCRDEYVRLMPNLPSSGKSIRLLIIDKFQSIKTCLKVNLKSLIIKNHRFSIITQEFTNISNRKYISVKVFGSHESGEPLEYSLGLVRVKGSLSSEKYAESILKLLSEYDIDVKRHIVGLTADNSKKMRKVAQLLDPVLYQICPANAVRMAMIELLFERHCDNHASEIPDDSSDDEDIADDSSDLLDSIHGESNKFESYLRSEEINDILVKVLKIAQQLKELQGVSTGILRLVDLSKKIAIESKDWLKIYEVLNEYNSSRGKIKLAFCQNCKVYSMSEMDDQKISGLVKVLEVVKRNLEKMCSLKSSCISIRILVDELLKLRFKDHEILGEELNKNIIKKLEECYNKTSFIQMLEWLKNPQFYQGDTTNLISSIVFHTVRLFPTAINSVCYDKDKDPELQNSSCVNLNSSNSCQIIDDNFSELPKPSEIVVTEKTIFDEIKEAKLTNIRGPILNLLLNAFLTLRPLGCEKTQVYDLAHHSVIYFKCQMTDILIGALYFLNSNIKLYVNIKNCQIEGTEQSKSKNC